MRDRNPSSSGNILQEFSEIVNRTYWRYIAITYCWRRIGRAVRCMVHTENIGVFSPKLYNQIAKLCVISGPLSSPHKVSFKPKT